MRPAGDYQLVAVVPSSYRPVHDLGVRAAAATREASWPPLSATLSGSGTGRHRRYGLGLPAAPTDDEKTGYSDRNLALIIRTSLASFGALLISQARFVFLNPVFTWVFLPFVVFTIAYYVISLCVNAGTRGVRPGRAPRARCRRGGRPATRPWTSSCPSAASRSRCCATRGRTSSSSSRAYPGTATAYVLDDGADERVRVHGRGLRVQLDLRALTAAG